MRRKLKRVGSCIVPALPRSIHDTKSGDLVARFKKIMTKINKSSLPVEDLDTDIRQSTRKKVQPATSSPFVRMPILSDDDED